MLSVPTLQLTVFVVVVVVVCLLHSSSICWSEFTRFGAQQRRRFTHYLSNKPDDTTTLLRVGQVVHTKRQSMLHTTEEQERLPAAATVI